MIDIDVNFWKTVASFWKTIKRDNSDDGSVKAPGTGFWGSTEECEYLNSIDENKFSELRERKL